MVSMNRAAKLCAQAPLATSPMDAFAEWRGDGARLVFTSFVNGDDEIFTMAPDGTNRIRLTNRAGVDSGATYRPGGSIMFVSDRSGALEIYTMAEDGTGLTQLTTGAALTSVPRATDQIPLRVQASYKYDALGRLREITTSQGALAQTVRYGYSGPVDSHSYTTNSSGEIETANWSGTGGLIATAHATAGSFVTSWYYFDFRGDTRAIADGQGQVTWSASYSEYGEIETSTGGSPQYGFVGAYRRISNPATGLIHMGARMYQPSLGRFLSRDPIVGGSANDYEYTGGDPINRLDVSGMYHVNGDPWEDHDPWWCLPPGVAGPCPPPSPGADTLGIPIPSGFIRGKRFGSAPPPPPTTGRGGIDWPEIGGRWLKRGIAFVIQPWNPLALRHGDRVDYSDVLRSGFAMPGSDKVTWASATARGGSCALSVLTASPIGLATSCGSIAASMQASVTAQMWTW